MMDYHVRCPGPRHTATRFVSTRMAILMMTGSRSTLPVEQILEVCDAGVRRLPLDDVASGFADDDTMVDAALGLCHQHLGRVAQSLGGNGLCGHEGVQ
jgi:hypothetical protein